MNQTDNIFQLTIGDLQSIVRNSVRDELSSHNQPQKEEKVLNSKEAASVLNISLPTLHKWKKEGSVPFHRKGGRIYFVESELVECILNPKIENNEK